MSGDENVLIPIRRISNFSYCPRLFYLQAVEKVFVESRETVEGTAIHSRVDQPTTLDSGDNKPRVLRSLSLDAPRLGITGILDFCEEKEDGVEIVDYKRGSAHRNLDDERTVKEWDAVQVMAQALLAEENGIKVKAAFVYYAEDRHRVSVDLSSAGRARCLSIIGQARECMQQDQLPPPLRHSSKCDYCSAYSICLPHESAYWSDESLQAAAQASTMPPKLARAPMAENDVREVLVVQTPGSYIGLRSGKFQVRLKDQTIREIPLHQLRALYLYGNVQLSTQALQSCLEEQIQVAFFSRAGRFFGIAHSIGTSGIVAKRGQYRIEEDRKAAFAIAQQMIATKIHNQRVLLLRNSEESDLAVKQMSELKRSALTCVDDASLRGIEGAAARLYFESFAKMLKCDAQIAFDFNGRNRRPPKDPVNALLSLGYSLLAKELTGILFSVGLDPFLGVFHRPRLGRPALALDLMEEFRPLIADSVALTVINRGMLKPADFEFTTRGVYLKEESRRIFWEAWFARIDTEVRHPEFGYTMSYRRMFEIQARQLWRIFCGEAIRYHGFISR